MVSGETHYLVNVYSGHFIARFSDFDNEHVQPYILNQIRKYYDNILKDSGDAQARKVAFFDQVEKDTGIPRPKYGVGKKSSIEWFLQSMGKEKHSANKKYVLLLYYWFHVFAQKGADKDGDPIDYAREIDHKVFHAYAGVLNSGYVDYFNEKTIPGLDEIHQSISDDMHQHDVNPRVNETSPSSKGLALDDAGNAPHENASVLIDPALFGQQYFEQFPKKNELHQSLSREELVKLYVGISECLKRNPTKFELSVPQHSQKSAIIVAGYDVKFRRARFEESDSSVEILFKRLNLQFTACGVELGKTRVAKIKNKDNRLFSMAYDQDELNADEWSLRFASTLNTTHLEGELLDRDEDEIFTAEPNGIAQKYSVQAKQVIEQEDIIVPGVEELFPNEEHSNKTAIVRAMIKYFTLKACGEQSQELVFNFDMTDVKNDTHR